MKNLKGVLTTSILLVGVCAVFLHPLFWVPLVMLVLTRESSFDRMVRNERQQEDILTSADRALGELVTRKSALTAKERSTEFAKLKRRYLHLVSDTYDLPGMFFEAGVRLDLDNLGDDILEKISMWNVEKVIDEIDLDLLRKAAAAGLEKNKLMMKETLRKVVDHDPDWLLSYLDSIIDPEPGRYRDFASDLGPLATPALRNKIRELSSRYLTLDDQALVDIKAATDLPILHFDARAFLENALDDLSIVDFNAESGHITGILLAQAAVKVFNLSQKETLDLIQKICEFLVAEYEEDYHAAPLGLLFRSEIFDREDAVCAAFVDEIFAFSTQTFSRSISLFEAALSSDSMSHYVEVLLPIIFDLSDTQSPADLARVGRCIETSGSFSKDLLKSQLESRVPSNPSLGALGLYSFLATEFGNADALETGLELVRNNLASGYLDISSVRVGGEVAHEEGAPVTLWPDNAERDDTCLDHEELDREPDRISATEITRFEMYVDAPLLIPDEDESAVNISLDDLTNVITAMPVNFLSELFYFPPSPWGDPEVGEDVLSEALKTTIFCVDQDGERIATDDYDYDYCETLEGYNPITGEAVGAPPQEVYWGPINSNLPFRIQVGFSSEEDKKDYRFDFAYENIDRFVDLLAGYKQIAGNKVLSLEI